MSGEYDRTVIVVREPIADVNHTIFGVIVLLHQIPIPNKRLSSGDQACYTRARKPPLLPDAADATAVFSTRTHSIPRLER